MSEPHEQEKRTGFRSRPPNTRDLDEDLDDGSPKWAAGLRADVRALALDLRTGLRTQTHGVGVIILVALALNAALNLAALYVKAGADGLELSTQGQP